MKFKNIFFFMLFIGIMVPSSLGKSGISSRTNVSNQISYFIGDVGFGTLSAEYLEFVSNETIIQHYDATRAMNGLNLFALKDTGEIFITDMNGTILASRYANNNDAAPEFINSTTVFYSSKTGPVQVLWNLKTNKTETFNISAGHHDSEYNPKTGTFLVFGSGRHGTLPEGYGDLAGIPISYDDIYEYDKEGNVVWYWNGSTHIPFESSMYLNETGRGATSADWMHGNVLFWDIEEDAIYYNPRNLDTLYKINKTTGDIVWSVGKYGNFTLYDKYGNQKESLWYHSHSAEIIGPNRFMMFDNDLWNTTRNATAPTTEFSRIVEFVINESDMTAREVFTWVGSEEYTCNRFGDADRLPNGNYIGCFGTFPEHPAYTTEVTPNGDIVWEFAFNASSLYRFERFLETPLINLVSSQLTIKEGDPIPSIKLSVWDNFKSRIYTNGSLSIYDDEDNLLLEKNFQFKPHWQETEVNFSISELTAGTHDLDIVIENSAGLSATQSFTLTIQEEATTEPSTSTSTTTSGTSGFEFFSVFFGVIGLVLVSQHRKRK